MIFLSVSMLFIPGNKTMFGPVVLVSLWPCTMLPGSMTIAFVHASFVSGSGVRFSKLVIVSPVSGLIIVFAKLLTAGVALKC